MKYPKSNIDTIVRTKDNVIGKISIIRDSGRYSQEEWIYYLNDSPRGRFTEEEIVACMDDNKTWWEI